MSARRLSRLSPFVFALYPACALLSANLGQHPLRSLIAPLAVSLLLALLAATVARLSTRDAQLAAFRAFGLLFLFFAAGHVRFHLPGYTQIPSLGLLLWPRQVADLVFVLAAVLLFRVRPRNLDALTTALAVIAFVLLATAAVPIAWAALEDTEGRPRAAGAAKLAPERAPHVFYIVLDGYGREDVLREMYGHDNSAFLRALGERGFYVASRAQANYCQTALSLASSLNMEYVDTLIPVAPRWPHDRTPLTRVLQGNRVMAVFRAQGYAIVAFSTGYSPAEVRSADHFDRSRAPSDDDEFFQGFLELTPIAPLRGAMEELAWVVRGGDQPQPATWSVTHRAKVLATLGDLPSFAAARTPLFVFAHVVAPHPPFVFDRRGAQPRHVLTDKESRMADGDHWRGVTGLDAPTYRRRYVEQLLYLNQRVLGVVDEILARARRPVVILIQSDHGPGSGLTWNEPRRTDLRERLGILSAYRLPDGPGDLYPTITPVNSFRVVLSRVLGLDLPRLPDRSFFSTWRKPYEPLPLREGSDGILRLEAERASARP